MTLFLRKVTEKKLVNLLFQKFQSFQIKHESDKNHSQNTFRSAKFHFGLAFICDVLNIIHLNILHQFRVDVY